MTNTRLSNRAGRRLVLVDIENMAGTPTPSPQQVESVQDTLAELVPDFAPAHLVVACSHRAAHTVAFAYAGDRHLWRSGPDGADLALLDVFDAERVADRFEFLTICSGDGIFTDAVARLAELGVDTAVIARQGHLAARLKLAAGRVDYVPVATEGASFGNAS